MRLCLANASSLHTTTAAAPSHIPCTKNRERVGWRMCSKLNAKVWLVMYVMYYYCAKSPWAGTRQLSINHQLQSLLVKVIKGSWFDYSVICLIDSHIVWSPSYLLCYESLISHIFNSPPASLTDISFISPLSLTHLSLNSHSSLIHLSLILTQLVCSQKHWEDNCYTYSSAMGRRQ